MNVFFRFSFFILIFWFSMNFQRFFFPNFHVFFWIFQLFSTLIKISQKVRIFTNFLKFAIFFIFCLLSILIFQNFLLLNFLYFTNPDYQPYLKLMVSSLEFDFLSTNLKICRFKNNQFDSENYLISKKFSDFSWFFQIFTHFKS